MVKKKTKKKIRGKSSGVSKIRQQMKKKLKDRLKEDQEQRESGGKGVFKSGTGVNFWNPQGGDHIVDIIPYVAGANHSSVDEGDPAYVLKLAVHYGIGPTEDKSYVCLAETFGKPCPICMHRAQLKNEGADDDVWKALYPKRRTIYNIYCWDSQAEEDKGVQVWEVADFYFQKHLDTLAKGPRRPGRGDYERRINFIDPDDGKSISFTIKPPRSKNDFAEYIGHRFDDRDYVISDEMLESTHVLEDLIVIPTFEEVYEEYWGEPYDSGNEDEEEDDDDIDNSNEEEDDLDDGEEKDDDMTCPGGGQMGVDVNELEYCETCDKWDECMELHYQLEEEEEENKHPTRRKKTKVKKKIKNRSNR